MNIEGVTREELAAVCDELGRLTQPLIISPERAHRSNLVTSFARKVQATFQMQALRDAAQQKLDDTPAPVVEDGETAKIPVAGKKPSKVANFPTKPAATAEGLEKLIKPAKAKAAKA